MLKGKFIEWKALSLSVCVQATGRARVHVDRVIFIALPRGEEEYLKGTVCVCMGALFAGN